MTTYTVRLEHGRRRKDVVVPERGPLTPAYLQYPVEVSHAQVEVDDFDQHGRLRHDADMENEARLTAIQMHTDRPGHPTDMVTSAQVIGAIG